MGPETIIARPIEGGTYGLVRQAEECPDGFGIGWYPADGQRQPVRIGSRSSIRTSEHLLEVPRRYTSGCVLADVRSGTTEAELGGVQPLAHGPFLFMVEGTIERFDELFLRRLVEGLSDQRYAALRGRTPAEVIFALWLDALEGEDPDAMASALEAVIAHIQALATDNDAPMSLAVLATDGDCLLALRTATHGPPPPLYTTVADDRSPVPSSARLVATEPTFPGSWQGIEPHALTIFTIDAEDAAPEPLEAFSLA